MSLVSESASRRPAWRGVTAVQMWSVPGSARATSAPVSGECAAAPRGDAAKVTSASTRSGRVAASAASDRPPSSAEQDGALDADRVHHREGVVGVRLAREVGHERVRAARVAASEADDPREAPEAIEQPRGLRKQPRDLDVRCGRPAEEQVDIPGAVDLVRPQWRACDRLACLRDDHGPTLLRSIDDEGPAQTGPS